jgi:single-stranded DNA-binding protein
VIRAAVYGRFGGDPIERTTHTGNPMVTASLAVNVARGIDTEDIEWVSIVAFGALIETLLRHQKGDCAAITGQLCRRRFATRDGQEKVGWSLTADSIVSARTVRPGGRPKSATSPSQPRRTKSAPRMAKDSGPSLPSDRLDDLWGPVP